MAKYKKRPDGRYQVNVYTHTDPRTGIRKYKTLYAKSVPELERKKAEIVVHVTNGTYADDRGYTVRSWGKKWLQVYKSDVSYNTLCGYENIINNHFDLIADIKLRNLKKLDIQQAINDLDGHYDLQRRLKLTLNQMLEAAIDDGLVYKNVCRNVTLPKSTRKEKRSLTKDELKAIEKCDFTDKEKAFVYLLLHTGIRRGEALALTRNDIDLQNDVITINKSLVFKNNQSFAKDPKSKSSFREIDILSPLRPVLQAHIDASDSLYLFTNAKGEPMTRMAFRRFWEQIYSKINIAAGGSNKKIDKTGKIISPKICAIDGLTPHIFRHNFASTLFYAGVDIKEAQRIMGHADTKVLLDVYTHLDKKKSGSKEKLELFIAN